VRQIALIALYVLRVVVDFYVDEAGLVWVHVFEIGDSVDLGPQAELVQNAGEANRSRMGGR